MTPAVSGGWPQPAAHGPSLGPVILRAQPEHFDVEELPNWSPTDDGEHDVLFIEKRGANTRWVADQLARHAGCHPRDVGHAGLKDRHAVTRQWFSVQRGGRAIDWGELDLQGVEVLAVHAHRRKLRPGALAGNRFRIVAAPVEPFGDTQRLAARVARVAATGVPNYFGPQRFGREGGNLELAVQLARGERLARASRGFALSAARGALFNAILATRVTAGTWLQPQPGDALMLTGSQSFFAVDAAADLDALRARADAGDLQPSGPLWGAGDPVVHGDILALESSQAAAHPDWVLATERARAQAARRSLRVFAQDLEVATTAAGLVFSFSLPAGSFATAVLNEFVSVAQ